MTTSPLPGLPQELHDFVFSTLDPKRKNALVQVSKKLYTAAIPSLYESIDLEFSKMQCYDDVNAAMPRWPRLLETLIKKPHYGTYVKKARFRLEPHDLMPHKARANEPVPVSSQKVSQMWDSVRAALEDSDNPEWYSWYYALSDNKDLSTPIALILSLLPNLQELEIDIDFLGSSHSLIRSVLLNGLTQQSVFPSGPTFHNIQRFSIVGSGIVDEQQLPEDMVVVPFFLLPRLKELSLYALTKGPQDSSLIQMLTGLSLTEKPSPRPHLADLKPLANLTTLKLQQTRIELSEIDNETALDFILKRTPSLTSLDVEFTSPDSEELSLDLTNMSTLTHVASTLQSLTIKLTPIMEDNIVIGAPWSFASFPALKRLTICPFLLTGTRTPNTLPPPPLGQLLPPNLECLLFSDELFEEETFDSWWEEAYGDDIFIPYLKAFIAEGAWRKATPKLKVMMLEVSKGNLQLVMDQTFESEGEIKLERNLLNEIMWLCEMEGLRYATRVHGKVIQLETRHRTRTSQGVRE